MEPSPSSPLGNTLLGFYMGGMGECPRASTDIPQTSRTSDRTPSFPSVLFPLENKRVPMFPPVCSRQGGNIGTRFKAAHQIVMYARKTESPARLPRPASPRPAPLRPVPWPHFAPPRSPRFAPPASPRPAPPHTVLVLVCVCGCACACARACVRASMCAVWVCAPFCGLAGCACCVFLRCIAVLLVSGNTCERQNFIS